MEFLKQKSPQEQSETSAFIRRVLILVAIFALGFLATQTFLPFLGTSPAEIFDQKFIYYLVYAVLLLSALTTFIVIMNTTFKVVSIFIVDLILGIEIFLALSLKNDLFSFIGTVIFVVSLLLGAIAIKNRLEHFTTVSFTTLLRSTWKWLSVGLIGFVIFSYFVTLGQDSFPVSENLFGTLLNSTAPIIQSFMPNLSFDKNLVDNLKSLTNADKNIPLPGLPDEVKGKLTDLGIDDQIKELNKNYGLNLTGREKLGKIAYLTTKAFYENRSGEQKFVLFLSYIVIILFTFQFIFWFVGIPSLILGFILIKLMKVLGLFKIVPAATTKETITL